MGQSIVESKRLLIIVTVVWTLARGFLPDTHVNPQQDFISILDGSFMLFLRLILAYAALMLAVIVARPKLLNNKYLCVLLDYRLWLKLGYAALIVIALLSAFGMLAFPISARGSTLTLGLVVIAAMWVINKYKTPASVLLGMLAATFIISGFEFVYQLIWYSFVSSDVGATGENLARALADQFQTAIPFIIIAILLRARLTKWSWFWMAVTAIMLFIKIVPGHGWIIYAYEDGIKILNEPINYPIYTISKLAKSAFMFSVLALEYRRLQ